MSIISIEKEQQSVRSIEKAIDAGANSLVFDILQKTQYTKPIDSCVRESCTNSIDALKEKEVAKLILTGKAKEEDYFIKRTGEQYKDSNFNKEYYNLEWFNEKDEVVITYTFNNGVGFCDMFEIKDTGVGMSPERLRNCLNLG
jgi:hypothetical protein